jgi:small-conductance mechanosensitive channel
MMDNDRITQVESVVDSIKDLVDILLEILSRPVVQRQLLAVLLILFIAWLLPEEVRRWRRKHSSAGETSKTEDISRKQRWLASLYYLLTPLLTLFLLNITIRLFAQQGYPNGLLADLNNLIWIWLIYRLLLTLLYAKYGEATRSYRLRIVTPIFLFLVVLQFLAVLPGSTTFADTIVGFGTISVTFGNLVTALIILYVFIVSAWVVQQIMIHTLPARLNAEPGVIESVATLTRYALLSLGIIFSLSFLGLDLTSLAIIAGGLSVGIGIGLQDIIANFVSGLVLLFEQSLRPGDVIELDGRISKVEKISLRATTVRTRTNEELIVPNSSFTTQQVKNLTKSDRLVRVIVPLGVSYKSDPELVKQIAIDTSLSHPLVLALPPPLLIFLGYGDSSLDFNLLVSTNQPELTVNIRSDLYYALWNEFAEHDIEIPFPQRDLNLGAGWERFTTDLPTT